MEHVQRIRRLFLLGMFLLASGSLILHFNIHSPLHSPPGLVFSNRLVFALVLFDVVGVTWLFSRKDTAAWGYLFNGLLVIYGTVFMTYFGWSRIGDSGGSFLRYVFHATTPEIIIAWADFFVGAALYRLWFVEPAVKG